MVMGSKAEKESSHYTLKLPLVSASHGQMQMEMEMEMKSPERSGNSTPPFGASASVPFRWENEPGKPKPCTTLITFSKPDPKCLELPPCRLLPTTTTDDVVEGPNYTSKAKFKSSSFRTGRECYGGSFGHKEKKVLFGSWTRALSARREGGGIGYSYVFPSYGDKDSEYGEGEGEESSNVSNAKITGIRRVGSFSGLSTSNKPHIWASIYQGIKQVVPWSKKVKKAGLGG